MNKNSFLMNNSSEEREEKNCIIELALGDMKKNCSIFHSTTLVFQLELLSAPQFH